MLVLGDGHAQQGFHLFGLSEIVLRTLGKGPLHQRYNALIRLHVGVRVDDDQAETAGRPKQLRHVRLVAFIDLAQPGPALWLVAGIAAKAAGFGVLSNQHRDGTIPFGLRQDFPIKLHP